MEDMRFNNQIAPEEKKEEEKEKKASLVSLEIWQKVKIKKQNIFFAIILLVVIISIGAAIVFYLKAERLQSESQTATVNDVQKIIEEVSKLIVLPKNEEPTVATISDAEKLRDQPFFANAKNGDKVLIYTKAQKAILYDPVKKIIIEVAPLNGGASENVKK